MTDKEAMAMALDALEAMLKPRPNFEAHTAAIVALKERLAQPKQEPVGWFTQARNFVPLDEFTEEEANLYGWNALYLHPPQREWVGLTDEAIENTLTEAVKAGTVTWLGYKEDKNGNYTIPVFSMQHFQIAQAIEAKLKQKNGYAEEKNFD